MSDPLAQIVAAQHHQQAVLRILGELDMSNVATIGEQLRAAAGGSATVIVDLTELGFMDSQGLRMLQRLDDELASKGTALIVIAPPTGIAGSILALTGMDKTLHVRPTLPD